jgi:GT2 family glycosyltransferase
VERRRGEARAASEEAERAALELRTTRSELNLFQYYLDETLRNANTERERLLAESAALRAAVEAVEKEGAMATLRRFRRKLSAAVVRTASSAGVRGAIRRWIPRRRAPSAAPATALSVEQFWKRLEPALARHAQAGAAEPARLSILTPTLNTPLAWLLDTVTSVLAQSTSAWEWCVVDDGSTDEDVRAVLPVLAKRVPRIKVALAERGGISAATNRALGLAEGEYVCFLDHDDLLAPTAVAEMLAKLDGGWDAVYSDEDKIDAAGQAHREPFHKPDWSPEYLRGVMYVGHLLAVRRELALRLGGLDSAFDGVQDFEFALRLSETTARVGHLPRILYHWRQGAGSLAADPQAKPGIDALQRSAVNAHLQRVGLAASAEDGLGPHRVRIVPRPRETHPRVSIIIPTRDAPGFLGRCLGSIYALTAYPNYEVVLVDNETRDPRALDIMQRFPVKRVPFPNPFNFSRANNLGAESAEGDFLLFLNNDTEIVARDWIDHLVYYAEQPDAGAVGSLLLYPNRTVQHAGIVLGFRGTADHVMRGLPGTADGYAGSLSCAREVTAVTAACMMVGARAFGEAGRFNEHFATHYQDVDLCLRLRAAGRRNIFTPRSVVLHLESATRGATYDMVDRMLLLDRWEEQIRNGDPFYNPNFDLARTDYALRTAG